MAALPALARPLTGEESTRLGSAVDRYLSATASNDAEGLVAAIPPRILNIFSGTAGIEAKDLKPTLEKQLAATLKDTQISNVTSDQSALDATDVTMSDGTAVTWSVVPTTFTADVKGKKTLNKEAVVALSEGGKWYILRVNSPKAKMLAAIAYPFISDVTLPEPETTAAP
jgi:hypothetical protein